MPKRDTHNTEESVAIGASQRVYGLFSAYNYSPWQALAEFIDNSVSSWQSMRARPRTPLKVDITWDPDFGSGPRAGKLIIEDSAGGIATRDLDRAFKLATPPADMSHLNQFGVGLKVAACWFARNWIVETSAFGESSVRVISWDTDDVVKRELQKLPLKAKKAPANAHFTRITLTALNHPPNHPLTIKKIKEYLPRQFRRFINKGQLVLTWNGDLLDDHPPETLKAALYSMPRSKARRWELAFTIKLSNRMQVRGTARLFDSWAKQHTALNFFWRDRLIQGNIEPYYRPQELFGGGNSFRTGRLSIDLEADQFEVTTDKKSIDFGRSKTSEGEILEKVKKALSGRVPLLQQGENFRSGKTGKELTPSVNKALKKGKEIAERYGEEFLNDEDDEPPPSSRRFGAEIAEQTIRHPLGAGEVCFRVKCQDASPQQPWVTVEWGSVRRRLVHRVSINLQHAFVQKYVTKGTVPIFIGLAVSTVYGELKARTLLGEKAQLVGHHTDTFLRMMATKGGVDDADED